MASKKDKGKPAKKPEESDDDLDYVEVNDPAAEFLDTAVRKTPWWAISVAFHVVVLGSLTLITFAIKAAEKNNESVITFKLPTVASAKLILPENAIRGDRDSPKIPGPHESDDKPLYFPEAVIGETDESDDGDKDHHEIKGTSMDALAHIPGMEGGFIGRKPGATAGVHDIIGPGGGSGSGSNYGGKFGGSRNIVRRRLLGSPATESAVEAGLRWLARHQHEDGHWDAEGFAGACKGCCDPAGKDKGFREFDAGITSLSLLAFLGAGYTPQIKLATFDPITKKTGRHGDVVRKGLKWLIDHQSADGAIGPQVGEMMYNHAIAALALSEAYGLTGATIYRGPAQKAIAFIHQAQNYQLGWRYTPRSGQNDTSVTGWCVMALKSAQISGLDVAQTSYEGAKAWVARVTQDNGKVGYDRLGSGAVCVPGKNDQWQHHESMTAVGILCRAFIDRNKTDEKLAKGAEILVNDLPRWDPSAREPTVDFYYWYYASLALFQVDGPDGQRWKKWNKALKDALLPHQRLRSDGCLDGSWDTGGVDRWAYAGGRVYGTAINVLTLEVYYRYQSVFGGEKR